MTRPRMSRALTGARGAPAGARHTPADEPRQVGRTLIDFGELAFPPDIRSAFADAFWNHYGARAPHVILYAWYWLKVFARFATETAALRGIADLDGTVLCRYIEWLGTHRGPRSERWSKATRCAAYLVPRTLLLWLERCRPGLLVPLDYPSNPFPFRNREHRHHSRLSPAQLHAILSACERDIARIRARRAGAAHAGSTAQQMEPAREQPQALNPFDYIDTQFGGILPDYRVLWQSQHRDFRAALRACGGLQSVRDGLYPTGDTIMPYYLAILIHTAGNPEAIAALRTDCLQPLPLLTDREVLVWDKPRAGSVQRRAFHRTSPLEPPALIREIIEWTGRLRPLAPATQRDRLFLFKSPFTVTSLDRTSIIYIRRRFAVRHALPDFRLASIRPSVLTAFYRASGDLSRVRAIANHAHLSTTVAYVQEPVVEAQNQFRVAMLQHAFLGHLLSGDHADGPRAVPVSQSASARATVTDEVPPGAVVSMFGFSCRDPFSGIAPGTRKGELCTNFLGCLTCPNAILAGDARTLARLLQARDHLKEAAQSLHPARWAAIYAPQLRILEEDILTRFSAQQLSAAQALRSTLPSLPPLR